MNQDRLIDESLRMTDPAQRRAWDSAMSRAFPSRLPFLTAAAAMLGVVIIMLVLRTGTDLGDGMLKNHRKYLAGALPLTVKEDVSRFFEDKFPFRTDLENPPGDVSLVGGRACSLNSRPCAYIVVRDGDATVSLFIADRAVMAGSVLRGRTGAFSYFAFRQGDRIVCAIGELELGRLESVVRALAGRTP